jgi:hypothetical protein
LKEVEERFPSSTQQTADPTKKADSCKIAQVAHQQEKSLKMATEDEVPLVYVTPLPRMWFISANIYMVNK